MLTRLVAILIGGSLLQLWAPTTALAGRVLYVTTTGDDTADGLSWTAAKRTVQAALNEALPGDEVWVAAGEYAENLTLGSGVALYGGFSGHEETLAERDWQSRQTILDGRGAGRVITVQTAAATGTRIDGFTIRNGSAPDGYGGGIFCSSGSLTIAHNRIVDNVGGYGGGVYGFGASVTITENHILANVGESSGGGIACVSCSGLIANNLVTENRAMSAGGGISCGRSASVSIANNTIIANSAHSGGGMHCSAPVSIVNNTLVANIAESGGGICSSGPMTVANNIVAFNTSGISASGSLPTLLKNCFYQPDGANYTGLDPGAGDINTDPQLPRASLGQIHLTPGSPCIDAGDDTLAQPGWTDIDGQARIRRLHVDIGADEYDEAYPPPNLMAVHVSPVGDDAADGLTWATAKRTVQAAVDAAPSFDGEVWVAAGLYVGGIRLERPIYLYGGFEGNETSLDQRNPGANESILDGNATAHVVSISCRGYRTCRIDGLTLRNGTSGVSSYSAHPVIANSRITANTVWPGAGITAELGSIEISGNTISDNFGGGIRCRFSDCRIVGNTIINNTAWGDGGGIWIDCGQRPGVVSGNVIRGNKAGLRGGGVWATYAGTLTGNTIVENETSDLGGGVYCSGLRVANNTIARNRAYTGGGIGCRYSSIAGNWITENTATTGGGIEVEYGSSPIANNTIAANVAIQGGAVHVTEGAPRLINNLVTFNSSGIHCEQPYKPVLSRNCVFNPGGANYVGLDPGPADQIADPKVVAAAYGKFHLAEGSPCIEAGDPAAPSLDGLDIDGQPRLQGERVDIGADEFNGTTPVFEPTIVRVSGVGDDGNDGSTWTSPKRTIQAGIDAAAESGGEVWVAEGTYAERISLRAWTHIYGGFAETEDAPDDRRWAAYGTTIDGEAAGSVVTARSVPGFLSCSVDGFTIRNGAGAENDGGGIGCHGASPAISNNRLIENTASKGGASVYADSFSSPLIVNNLIAHNDGLSEGGVDLCSGVIVNNTIVDNAGAGVRLHPASGFKRSTATVANNIIAHNNYAGNFIASDGTVRNNCYHPPIIWLGVYPLGNGNISADPRFVDRAAGDFRLLPGSPCIDAGSNQDVPPSLLTDLLGAPRFRDDLATVDCRWEPGTCGAAPVVDIGAYEFLGGDFDGDGDVDADDLARFIQCGSGPGMGFSPDCIQADLDTDGDVDQSDFGGLQQNLTGTR